MQASVQKGTKPSIATTKNLEIRTNNYELLMLKHDRAYSACESRSMCMLIKRNTILPGMAY